MPIWCDPARNRRSWARRSARRSADAAGSCSADRAKTIARKLSSLFADPVRVRRSHAQGRVRSSMRIAFTHNLRLTDSEEEAEFDTVETVDAIADGLRAGGHEVEKVEVTGPASHLAARIESIGPDLIFNSAEGRRGRAREAFYPAMFEELGFPYTGSDAYVLTVALDQWLTKLVLGMRGIDTPRAQLVTPDEYRRMRDPGTLGLALPVIVKPNYEGASKGIGDDVVARDARQLGEMLPRAVRSS